MLKFGCVVFRRVVGFMTKTCGYIVLENKAALGTGRILNKSEGR